MLTTVKYYGIMKKKQEIVMIGKVLQEILNEKNMNANELAKLIGVSNQTLYSIIKRNNMKIDFDILVKICASLDVGIERFYSEYQNSNIENIILSNNEKKLVLAYREQPHLHEAVEKVLGIYNDEEAEYIKDRAAFIKKHALPYAAAGGDASNLDEAQEDFDNALKAKEEKENG